MATNKHEDHEASCLCCEHFGLTYDGGYSEYTPGDGPQFSCYKNCFADTSYAPEVHERGRTCRMFEGREERK